MAFPESEWLLLFLSALAVLAFLYASVGHGGASGYLALMALFSLPPDTMKPTALLLNIFVSGVSFWFFQKHKHFRWKLFIPFALSSIPASFIGGSLSINPALYKQILGIFLLGAVLRIFLSNPERESRSQDGSIGWMILIGAGIGLFSGMIGIGGGIILTPLILLLGWGNMKEAAAVSALFIFVNSLAGISGFLVSDGQIPVSAFTLIPVVLLGGTIGAVLGSHRISGESLRYFLALVLLIAGVKLLLI